MKVALVEYAGHFLRSDCAGIRSVFAGLLWCFGATTVDKRHKTARRRVAEDAQKRD